MILVERTSVLSKVSYILWGVGLLTLSAKVNVPFYPVPITMQSLAVVLIALWAGRSLAVTTLLSYLILGLAGLPLFAWGGGPAYLLMPSAGYLYGFVVAAFIAGSIKDKGVSRSMALLLLFLAHTSIFLFGLLHLSFFMSWAKSLQVGLYPFILGFLFKQMIIISSYLLSKKYNLL